MSDPLTEEARQVYNSMARALRHAEVERDRYREALASFIDWYDSYAPADDPLSQADAVAALRQALEPIQ